MAGSSHNQSKEELGQELTWPAGEFCEQSEAANQSLSRSSTPFGAKESHGIKLNDTNTVVGRYRKGVNHRRLQYLKDTKMIEVRPGLTNDVSFVLTSRESVSHCKKVDTSLIICNYDDNKIIFAFPETKALPVAVSTPECDIGVIDVDTGKDYDISIDYNDLAGKEGEIVAWYQIKCQDENVGDIVIKLGLMTFVFDKEILVEQMALSIAYGINRALSNHLADLVKKTQPLQMYEEAFISLYENVFPLMQYVILRVVSKSIDDNMYQLALMDYKNQNKIVLVAKCDRDMGICTALDLGGNQLFKTVELIGSTRVMHVGHHNQSIGICQEGKAGDPEAQLRLDNGEVLKCGLAMGHDKQYYVADSQNNVICKITDVEDNDQSRTIKIVLSTSLQTNTKKVILSHIIKLAFHVFELHIGCIPVVKLSKFGHIMERGSLISFPSPSSEEEILVAEQGQPRVLLLNKSCSTTLTFRAAGHSICFRTQYYDVINDEGEICFTLEIWRPSQTSEYGMLKAKNEYGFTFFTVPDFLTENTMSLYNQTGKIMGYKRGKEFYNSFNKAFMCVYTAEEIKSAGNYICIFVAKGHKRAHLLESGLNLALTFNKVPSNTKCSRYLTLAYAMRLCYKLDLEKQRVPQIEYKYLAQNSDIKEY